MKPAWYVLLLAAGWACARDLGIEDRLYYCSEAVPCAAGFACHPAKRVCVREGEVDLDDAGAADVASGADAELPDSSVRPGPWCGNGVHELNERCDDGNQERGTAAMPASWRPFCAGS